MEEKEEEWIGHFGEPYGAIPQDNYNGFLGTEENWKIFRQREKEKQTINRQAGSPMI